MFTDDAPLAVVPVLIGPLQALIAILPGLLAALFGALLALFKPQTMKKLVLLLWAQKLPVLMIAAAVGGLIYAWPIVFPGSVVEGAAEGEWPAFRGGPERLGTVADDPDPAQGDIIWSHNAEKIYYSSPTVVGDKLYAVSARYETFKDQGKLFCLDAGTGKELWRYTERGFRATFSSPAIGAGGKYLVSGEGLHETADARIFCFDISGKPTKMWEYRTNSHVEASPCIANGKVYIGAGDDGYLCLALEPKVKGEPEVIWHLPGPKTENPKGERIYTDCETSPIVVDGKVYFGMGLGGKAVCCVDAESGKELWRIETPYPVFSAPTISKGKLYFGMGTGDFVNKAEVARTKEMKKMKDAGKSDAEIKAAAAKLGPVGEVWCVDLKTHAMDWRFPVRRTVLGSVAVKGDRVYFGSRDGNFYCISTKGKLLAKRNSRLPIVTSPAVGREHVYFMNEGGMVYGLDAESLEVVWELGLGQGALFVSSPALGNGHLYIGTDGNGVVCAGEPSTGKRTVIWAGHRGGPGHSGYGGGGMLPLKGAKSWNHPSGEGVTIPSITAPAACVEGAIYAGMNSEKEKGLEKIFFDAKKKDDPIRKWFYPTANPVHISAAATSEGDVYCVDGKKGDEGRNLHCIDSETGKAKWKAPVAADAEGALLVTSDLVLVSDQAGSLLCVDRQESLGGTPKIIWRSPVGSCKSAPFIVGGIAVVAASSEPHLAALDLETGAELWRTKLDSEPQTEAVVAHSEKEVPIAQEAGIAMDPAADADAPPPEPEIVMEDVVLVGSAKGVAAYDILSGEKLWDIACGSVRSVLVCSDTLAACLVEPSGLVLVDFTTGEEKKRIEKALPAIAPLKAGDGVLYCDKDSIQRYDLSTRKSKRWMKTSWLGAITTPIVGADSHLFFATDKRGLVCARPSKR